MTAVVVIPWAARPLSLAAWLRYPKPALASNAKPMIAGTMTALSRESRRVVCITYPRAFLYPAGKAENDYSAYIARALASAARRAKREEERLGLALPEVGSSGRLAKPGAPPRPGK